MICTICIAKYKDTQCDPDNIIVIKKNQPLQLLPAVRNRAGEVPNLRRISQASRDRYPVSHGFLYFGIISEAFLAKWPQHSFPSK